MIPIMGDTVKLGHILSTVAGRTVQTEEIVSALGVARSTYYLQQEEGRLISADNLLRLAVEFQLNPVELLWRCGLINADAVTDCADKLNVKPKRQRTRLGPRRDLPPV